MALTKEQKQQLVQEYSERLGRSQVLIWSKYSGLSVAQVQNLRAQLRGAGAEAVVVKNTLMGIALEGVEWPRDHEIMSGPSLVTFIYDDIAPAPKVLVEFARRNAEDLVISGGLIGGKLASADQVRSQTTCPAVRCCWPGGRWHPGAGLGVRGCAGGFGARHHERAQCPRRAVGRWRRGAGGGLVSAWWDGYGSLT